MKRCLFVVVITKKFPAPAEGLNVFIPLMLVLTVSMDSCILVLCFWNSSLTKTSRTIAKKELTLSRILWSFWSSHCRVEQTHSVRFSYSCLFYGQRIILSSNEQLAPATALTTKKINNEEFQLPVLNTLSKRQMKKIGKIINPRMVSGDATH